MWLIWVDQARDESRSTPRSLNEVTLSVVCEEIVSDGRLVVARWQVW